MDFTPEVMRICEKEAKRYYCAFPRSTTFDDARQDAYLIALNAIRNNPEFSPALLRYHLRLRFIDKYRSESHRRSGRNNERVARFLSLSAISALDSYLPLAEEPIEESQWDENEVASTLLYRYKGDICEMNKDKWRQCIADAIQIVDYRTRIITKLHYWVGVKRKEIASNLGVSLYTVAKSLNLFREILRSQVA